MNILALDTCTEPGSIALARDGELLESSVLLPGLRSMSLHLEIVRLLETHGLTTAGLDAYGVTSGPGSFTGVRVGMTAVKGLAEVHGKPVVPVSTLEALAVAAGHASIIPSGATLATLLDARRGQVFGGVYRFENSLWHAVVDESVSSLASFLDRLKKAIGSGALSFCGMGMAQFVAEIEKAGWSGASIIEVQPCLAGPLALTVVPRLEQGSGVDAASAGANYVRLSDAELFWKG